MRLSMLHALIPGGLACLVAGACFQADFMFYGPECGSSDDCVGDGSRCFEPIKDSPGYCARGCDSDRQECASFEGHQLSCLEVDKIWSCILTCEVDSDCPSDMRCSARMLQNETRNLCILPSS